jgi:S1-C subfamily serine protease
MKTASRKIIIFAAVLVPLLLIFGIADRQMPNRPTAIASPIPSLTLLPTTPVSSPTASMDDRLSNLESEVKKLNDQINHPPKDIWDKISAVSGLVSGLLIAIIGGIATFVYRERERNAEEATKNRELSVQQVQTIQSFMPQLQSGNEKAVEAALLAITALGNSKLATDLATLYRTEGAAVALSKIASGPNRVAAQQAEQSLQNVFVLWNSAIVIVASEGVTCAGFIFRSEGYIITTDLALNDPENISVTSGEKVYKAVIIARQPEENLAILKISNGVFPTLGLVPPTQTNYPQDVFVLGPDPTMGWVVSGGRVTGLEQDKNNPSRLYIRAQIETKPGYAGVPILNGQGQVVGMALRKDLNGRLLIPATAIEKFISETII